MRAFVIKTIRDGGLTFTAECPEDDECYTGPAFNPRTLKATADKTVSDLQVKEAFGMLLKTLERLQSRVTALESVLGANQEATEPAEAFEEPEPLTTDDVEGDPLTTEDKA